MIAKVILLCLVASSLAEKCCVPDTWEGIQQQSVGSIKNGIPTMSEETITIHYDLTKNVAAFDESVTANGYTVKVKVIMDFKAGTEYIISGNHCSKKVISHTSRTRCVPDNAKFEGSHFGGSGNNKVMFNSYSYQAANVTAHFSMTNPGCVPVSQIIYGSTNGVQYFVSQNFYDITPGVKDPTVFNVPSICDNAMFVKGPSSTHVGILGQ
ncbi:hypothetical protein LOTGIDRAFT_154656 [Lottia gigantea]|uniref:Mammalian ependymin-related protein 1 n=1 Tax=Lottia gigantea TaxID=225164 RepID=V4BE89_LOTGI|nr:hypothetical protein LOTGIDRAFT_154656 [Lottia gigantea]ESO87154.1 hypothetical protein LOTGIDRAFT_154656 [Lottia gigantea]